jgi:hypothetical protein
MNREQINVEHRERVVPLTAGEQKYHEEVVLPLIQKSFETARAAEKELRDSKKTVRSCVLRMKDEMTKQYQGGGS